MELRCSGWKLNRFTRSLDELTLKLPWIESCQPLHYMLSASFKFCSLFGRVSFFMIDSWDQIDQGKQSKSSDKLSFQQRFLFHFSNLIRTPVFSDGEHLPLEYFSQTRCLGLLIYLNKFSRHLSPKTENLFYLRSFRRQCDSSQQINVLSNIAGS